MVDIALLNDMPAGGSLGNITTLYYFTTPPGVLQKQEGQSRTMKSDKE